jgi:FkbM family methyltransferase
MITPYVLLEQEDWFEHEIRFARRLLPAGGRAIDIGANYGLYTLALAGAAGPQGRVWAFEPTPLTADYLGQSLELNGYVQVQLMRRAVSARSGTARLRVGEHAESNSLAAADTQGTIEVATTTLDDLAREFAWDGIDFVKIDVEGHESEVIGGGKAFFESQSPLVMFEVASPGGMEFAPARHFQELGYRMYRLVPGLGLLAPFALGDALDAFTLNLFCCKPDRARRLQRAGLLAIGAEPSDSAQAVPADAVSSHRAARDVTQDPDSRLWLLQRALHAAGRAFAAAPSLAGVLTFTRIAADAGEREAALRLLLNTPESQLDLWQDAMRQPHLAPDARFDDIDAGPAGRAWFECALFEAIVTLRAHSTVYAGQKLLPLLDKLLGNPVVAPRSLRARQLLRMRFDLQSGPEPHPLLVVASERNLNPGYWRGNSIVR